MKKVINIKSASSRRLTGGGYEKIRRPKEANVPVDPITYELGSSIILSSSPVDKLDMQGGQSFWGGEDVDAAPISSAQVPEHEVDYNNDNEPKAPAMSDPVSKDLLDAHLGRIEEKILHSEARLDGKLNLLLEKFTAVQEVYTEQNKNVNEHLAHTQQLYAEQHQGVKDQISNLKEHIDRVWQISLGIFGSLLVGFIILIAQNMMEKPDKPAPPVVIYSQPPSTPVQTPAESHNNTAPSKPR